MTGHIKSRKAGILGSLACPLGLGLLRLASQDRPERQTAIAIIHAAFEMGIRLLDTADSYCLNDKESHYGEQLAREAIETWSGPRDEIKIITKVGLVRPQGKWLPSASPKQLIKAVEGSLQAFKVERLFLLQLHAKDPRVPFEQTLAALAELQRAGKVEHLGLCNVGVADVRQAQRHFRVESIQNELNILTRSAATDGLLRLTQDLGIPFLAHRPIGGYAKVEKIDKNRVLNPIAKAHQVSPREIALAAVLDAAPHVIPLIGATRLESLTSCAHAISISLAQADREALESKYSFAATPEAIASLAPRVIPTDLPTLQPGAGPGDTAEVVILMGIQGAGKSHLVDDYVQHGYVRLNRDVQGGKLDDLLPQLKLRLAEGTKRVVLDNTYPTRTSRAPVITAAHEHSIPVRCRWLNTPVTEARINVVNRMLERHGRLLGPVEMKELSKIDPNLPPPIAMQKWMDSLEPPEADEGFSAIDELPFHRRHSTHDSKLGLLLDVDGTLRKTKSGEIYPRHPDDVELLPNRREVLLRWIDQGYSLFFVSNQSGIASGHVTQQAVDDTFGRTVELLNLPVVEVAYCPHPAFPVGCFCRKPMPGMAIDLMRRHHLSWKQLVVVGDMESDASFAAGIQAQYFDAGDFFKASGNSVRWTSVDTTGQNGLGMLR